MATMEQVQKELTRVKSALEETREPLHAFKEQFGAAKLEGNKDRMKEITSEMDKIYKRRTELKSDLYALMAEENRLLQERAG